MKNTLLSIAAAGAMLVSGSAFAAESYTFDKAHTNILLKVSHLGFSNFYMEVRDYEGGFVFDAENPTNSSVNVSMKAASIDGDHDGLNEHLQGKDFFEVASYPHITFKSTGIEVSGEKTGKITGDLTIKDVTKPVTLDVTFNKKGENPFSKAYHAGFSGSTVIKRSDFGINYAVPAVSDEVEIVLEVEGIRQEGEAH